MSAIPPTLALTKKYPEPSLRDRSACQTNQVSTVIIVEKIIAREQNQSKMKHINVDVQFFPRRGNASCNISKGP